MHAVGMREERGKGGVECRGEGEEMKIKWKWNEWLTGRGNRRRLKKKKWCVKARTILVSCVPNHLLWHPRLGLDAMLRLFCWDLGRQVEVLFGGIYQTHWTWRWRTSGCWIALKLPRRKKGKYRWCQMATKELCPKAGFAEAFVSEVWSSTFRHKLSRLTCQSH